MEDNFFSLHLGCPLANNQKDEEEIITFYLYVSTIKYNCCTAPRRVQRMSSYENIFFSILFSVKKMIG